MKKILVVFGTRPEAIKLAPLVEMLKNNGNFNVGVCLTGQHREMLDQVVNIFGINVDHDLDLMCPNQSLSDIFAKGIVALSNTYKLSKPNLVIVQGDTTTAFMAALAAFYEKIPVAHVEAGLRTGNKYSPYPEEINRLLIRGLADFHFAPTQWAKENLLKEGVENSAIWVSGNTGIDALYIILNKYLTQERESNIKAYLSEKKNILFDDNKINILVTGHRRENFGLNFKNICHALKKIAELNDNIRIIYPVHLNPNIQKPVYDIIGDSNKRICLLEPLNYETFVYLMKKCYLVLTDSGGIQEEAPSLGKPVLVMRDTTERPEGVEAGVAKLVGTNIDSIISGVNGLLNSKTEYDKMAQTANPYGDGTASTKITKILEQVLC